MTLSWRSDVQETMFPTMPETSEEETPTIEDKPVERKVIPESTDAENQNKSFQGTNHSKSLVLMKSMCEWCYIKVTEISLKYLCWTNLFSLTFSFCRLLSIWVSFNETATIWSLLRWPMCCVFSGKLMWGCKVKHRLMCCLQNKSAIVDFRQKAKFNIVCNSNYLQVDCLWVYIVNILWAFNTFDLL